ncbi:hypothetical protein KAW50_01450 [candidate division WOR-3 bacterium]|nr:hypothetical protein [candidate division WOR-3 bacterium]
MIVTNYKLQVTSQRSLVLYLLATCYSLLATSLNATWYSADLLSLNAGPRAHSMGCAYTAIADDPFSPWWNPAGIIKNQGPYIAGMQTRPFGLENFNFISAGYPHKKFAFSILAASLKINEIQRLPDTLVPEPIGFFEDQELVLFLSTAYKIRENTEVGINIKHLRYNLDDTQAKGFGVDIGISSKFNNIPIGLVIKDIGGTRLKWDTGQRDCRQTNFVGGAAYSFNNPSIGNYYLPGNFLLSADIGYEYKPFCGIGVEYSLKNMLFLRSGFSGKSNSLNAGIGIKVRNLSIDYSFSPHDLGVSHQISASITFFKITSPQDSSNQPERQRPAKTRKRRKSTRQPKQ